MASDFYKQWQDAKKKFETDTGKKKPSAKFLGIFRSAGLDTAAKAFDNIEAKYKPSEGRDPKNADSLKKAANTFKKDADKYLVTLDHAIDEEDKTAQPEYRRSLKVLSASLKALAEKMQANAEAADSQAKKLGVFEFAAKGWNKTTKSVVANALKFVQEVKQNPTPDVFNYLIQKTARDITQQLGNLAKLRQQFPPELFPQYGLPEADAKPFFDALTPWADKGRKVAENASAQVVLDELKAFSSKVKVVVQFLGIT
jgi:hypothetical protein